MSHFLRLLTEEDKGFALQSVCANLRAGNADSKTYNVKPETLFSIPTSPFSYWCSDDVRRIFHKFEKFSAGERTTKQGLGSADDFRFVRVWWEIINRRSKWFGFAKGGSFSRFYSPIPAIVNWENAGSEIENNLGENGNIRSNIWMLRDTAVQFFSRPGITWPLRGIHFSAQAVPEGCLFSVAGKMAFSPRAELDAWLALFNSRAFDYLICLFAGKVGGVQYQNGLIGMIPVPKLSSEHQLVLGGFTRKAWSLRRNLDTIEETSHAFLLPSALRSRLGDYDPPAIQEELARIQTKIDDIAYDLYGFNDADRTAARGNQGFVNHDNAEESEDDENFDEDSAVPIDVTTGLLSWTVAVSFGRFDWRLATGERLAPTEPKPFDPLPAKSPGMLLDRAEPFHAHEGILVDDQGHQHDLTHLIEEVLARVEVPVPEDVRRWLQRDFFAFHLQRYSKSRRKAPIYWPLSTTSRSYTLWVYYPSLTSQTLYTAINDFVEPKLKQVGADVTALRNKGSARTREDEKQFEALQAFELELIELRDTLLKLAPTYKPNHDDGVQITAAPLWPLFRHKPWQKVLKDTWAKLEKGDYDWAHLAMNYWPERVREKCKTDKSLAIAHGLEDLYIEPEALPKKTRGRKKSGGDE